MAFAAKEYAVLVGLMKLKNCPFCNGANTPTCQTEEGWFVVLCYDCEARGPPGATGEIAEGLWNKRGDMFYRTHRGGPRSLPSTTRKSDVL